MTARGTSSSKTILIVLIILLTFPFWIAAGGIALGLAGALIGIIAGILGALLGGVIALIAIPFKIIFGWHDWSFHLPGFHLNGYVWLAIIIFAALVISKRGK